MLKRFLNLSFGFLTILLFSLCAEAQIKNAPVSSVGLTTKDKISIKISMPRTRFKLGDEIVVDYQVRNSGKVPVYLVTDSNVELWSYEHTLWVKPPIKYPDEFKAYNYEFTEVKPGKTLIGKSKFSSLKITVDKDYAEEIWKLQLGFAYLFDKSGLYAGRSRGREFELSEVLERSEVLNVGSLVFEIEY